MMNKWNVAWLVLAFGLVLASACSTLKKDKSIPKLRYVEVLDPKLHNLIDVNAEIEVLAEGFEWSEGPLWIAELDALIFSDVPQNVIYSWNETTGLDTFLIPSGYTKIALSNGEGSNGLILSPEGELVLCQHGDRRVAKMKSPLNNPKSEFETMTQSYQNKRYNSPNDGCYDQLGRLYFTDPPYGLTNLDNSVNKELPFNGVYRLDKMGNVVLIDSTLSKPNGIDISPDHRQLVVANSDPSKAYWVKYDILEEGKVTNRASILEMTDAVSSENPGLPDGLKFRSDGLLFATGPGGVLIMDLFGNHLGTIRTGVATANCTFDDDEQYLYMTADAYLMRININ